MFGNEPTLNLCEQVHTHSPRTSLCIFKFLEHTLNNGWVEYTDLFAEQCEFMEWHHFVITFEQHNLLFEVEHLPDVQVVLKSDEFFEEEFPVIIRILHLYTLLWNLHPFRFK